MTSNKQSSIVGHVRIREEGRGGGGAEGRRRKRREEGEEQEWE